MTWLPRFMLLLLVACGSVSPGLPGAPEAAVEVRTALDGPVVARGGRVVVVVEHDADLSVDVPELEGSRLSFQRVEEERVERVGDRVVRTAWYSFTGSEGSHVIPPVEVAWTEGDQPQSASSQPLYVDLGTPPPRPGELADIAEPEPLTTWPLWLWLTAIGVVLLGAVGLRVAFADRGTRTLAAVPMEAPDVIALRAWETVRADDSLGDYDKAMALSRIFREYTEAVLGFGALALTTTELLARLGRMTHLEAGNVPRARRLLRATDRIKYAEEGARDSLFEDLDSDLRAFVSATRPHHWEPEVVESRVVQGDPDARPTQWLATVNRLVSMLLFVAAAASAWRAFGLLPGGLVLAMLTGVLASVLLVMATLHGMLGFGASARRLRALQLALAGLELFLVPFGTAYGLFALWVVFATDDGRAFYAGRRP